MACSTPSGLFRWKRKTDPVEVARGKKKNNVKDWIKRVQDASEDAAKEAYGANIFDKQLTEIYPDDQAVYEAQELLDDWLKNKQFPDLNNELDYKNENWSATTGLILNSNECFEKKQDSLLSFDDKYWHDIGHMGNDFLNSNEERARDDYSSQFLKLEDIEDDEIDNTLLVQDVLQGMLDKQLVKNIDLGMKPLTKKVKDPTPKMNLRHQQVKQRSEARHKKIMNKNQERLLNKDIQLHAREAIAKEEKERLARQKREEKAVQMEMVKIRKEMEEERKNRNEEMERKKKILEQAKMEIQNELRKQKGEQAENKARRKQAANELRIQIQKEIEESSMQKLKEDLQILSRYFSAWYNLILERRINLGKCRAICDWKCMLKAWNAWIAYITCLKSNQDAKAMEHAVKRKYRKEQMAIFHWKRTLLQLYFISWLKYTRHQLNKKILAVEHENKARKMAMFLEAASKGSLWQEKDDESCQNISPNIKQESRKQSKALIERPNTAEMIDEIFLEKKEKESLHLGKTSTFVANTVKDKTFNRNIETFRSSGNKNNRKKLTQEKNDSWKKKKLEEDATDIDNSLKQNIQPNVIPDAVITVISDQLDKPTSESCVQSNVLVSTLQSRKPHVQSNKPTTKPLFLAMEERARIRKERKALVEEEKQKKDQERLKILQGKEAERLRLEQHEKEELMKKKREERQIKAQKERKKQLRLEKQQTQNTLATNHYNQLLLQKYGMEPWKRLMEISKLNIQISGTYQNSLLMRLVFNEWFNYAKQCNDEKRRKADLCFDRILIKRSFHLWLKCRFHLQFLNKVARNYNLQRIKKRAFNAWQDYVTDERILMWAKESTADEHNERRILNWGILTWIQFVEFVKEERIRELRRNNLRKKVQTWLPDYNGGLKD